MFFVILIFPIIFLTIFEGILSSAMHLILHPMSKISSAVLPFITTVSSNLIFVPISIISASLYPNIFPLAMFLAVSKLPFKNRTFWPNLLPFTVLLAIKPFSSIRRPIFILIDSKSMHLILKERTFKEVSIVQPHLSFSMSPALIKMTYISTSIFQSQLANTTIFLFLWRLIISN